MKNASNNMVKGFVGRLVSYTTLVLISAVMIRVDAGFLYEGRKFSESSFTEWTQEVFILLTVLLLFFTAKRSADLRPVSYLAGGGFVVVLIREKDALLDVVYHGAWFPVALVALAATVYAVYRQRQHFRKSFELFLASPAVGYFVAGGLGVFVFSRLFGSKRMWSTLFAMDDLTSISPARWVKNAAEEGTELFGYCMILCGSIELLSFAHRRLGVSPP